MNIFGELIQNLQNMSTYTGEMVISLKCSVLPAILSVHPLSVSTSTTMDAQTLSSLIISSIFTPGRKLRLSVFPIVHITDTI